MRKAKTRPITLATLRVNCCCGGQAVDAAGDHPLHGVGEVERSQVARVGRDPADPVADLDQAGVAQGIGQFFAEEGVALGPLADQRGHRLGQRGHAQALADQGQRVVGRQRFQAQPVQVAASASSCAVLGRRRLGQRAGRQHQQQRLAPAGYAPPPGPAPRRPSRASGRLRGSAARSAGAAPPLSGRPATVRGCSRPAPARSSARSARCRAGPAAARR